MRVFDRLRHWWRQRTGEEETPFDGDSPAWIVSIGVHLLALVVLAIAGLQLREPDFLITLPALEDRPEEITKVCTVEEVEKLLLPLIKNIKALDQEQAGRAAVANVGDRPAAEIWLDQIRDLREEREEHTGARPCGHIARLVPRVRLAPRRSGDVAVQKARTRPTSAMKYRVSNVPRDSKAASLRP